jgi:hypothetical protein
MPALIARVRAISISCAKIISARIAGSAINAARAFRNLVRGETMNDPQSSKAASAASHFILHAVLKEWPYLLMLALALTRWQKVRTRDPRLRLVWTQTLHWAAVLLAMQLMFVADVGKMMNF